jgi:PAS domain S-box-containing protein
MVQFNTKDNEILVKIVFYGPSLSGKTTNLQKLHELMDTSQRTDLFSVNTMEDRTLFFDLLPMDLGYVYGNSIKLQIYTVPGQVHYDSTRRIVLSGADGVVFVADSDQAKLQDNVQSINNLYHNLQANRLNIKEVPLVMQYNKRDLPNVSPVETLNQKLNFRNVPSFETVAVTGEGVMETFLETVKMTVRYIFEKYQLSKSIKNVDSVIEKLEKSLISTSKKAASMRAEKAEKAPTKQERSSNRTVLKYTHNVNRTDNEAQDNLLKKAITSNMETARLYSELKKNKDELVKKNEELNVLYKQLEKSNTDNLKIRRFLESLVNFAGEAIVTYNETWAIQNWNQAAEELFGYRRDEILNKNVNILFPQDSVSDLNRVLGFVSQGKVVRGFETRLQAKTGEAIQVNITFSPIKNKTGTITAYTAIIRDLSFMSKMNRQLYEIQRHEAAHPFVESLMATIESNGQLSDTAQTAVTLIRQLAAEPRDEMAPVSLNQVIESLQKGFAASFQKQGIAWQAQLNPSVPNLYLDLQQLLQALSNLVLNAAESMAGRPTKKFTIGTHFANNEALVQIIDTGEGMSPDEMDRSVDPGQENKRSIAATRLNASRESIKKNGGTIRVDSSPGKGTKVTIRFPQG